MRRGFVLHLYTKFEFRTPYHSEDIRHFVCVRITPSVTLIFDLLTLKLVRNIALVVGTFQPILVYLRLSVLELWTDTRQTGHVTLGFDLGV